MMHLEVSMLRILAIVLVLSLSNRYVQSLELRYKVCTAEELRRSVEQFCMRLGRSTNSALSLSPYGSISAIEVAGGRSDQTLDETLIEIIKASRIKSSRVRSLRAQRLVKRDQESKSMELCDYLSSCCNESCVINPMDLIPHCKSI